jgi:zinc protease
MRKMDQTLKATIVINLFLWSSSVLALRAQAPASATLPEIDIPYQKFLLPNGLTLIVHEDRKAPIVAVNVWYHVGSKNEKPSKSGFAHLFEHLMFNGSENFNTDYFQAMERIGATDLNGTTNTDRTNYFQNVPKSALDVALWMESDRMGHLLGVIDQARLDEQRGVVQNEKRQGENQPYGVTYELITKATYPAAHPYSWTVIGSMEDLNAAALDDVKEWFKTYYGAANAVIVIAGDVDAQTAKTKVEKFFGDIPSGPPVARHEA